MGYHNGCRAILNFLVFEGLNSVGKLQETRDIYVDLRS
jgi:hypothetical protein